MGTTLNMVAVELIRGSRSVDAMGLCGSKTPHAGRKRQEWRAHSGGRRSRPKTSAVVNWLLRSSTGIGSLAFGTRDAYLRSPSAQTAIRAHLVWNHEDVFARARSEADAVAGIAPSALKPATPSSMTSATEPQRNTIPGVPHAIASIMTRPKGSGQSIGKSSADAPLSKWPLSASLG